jgi:hypothetical protein
MLKDFEVLRKQLEELADTINKFKSEAVQLRIVELVLHGRTIAMADATENHATTNSSRRRRKGRPSPRIGTASESAKPAVPKKKTGTGSGANATLTKVYAEGFFESARTINDILRHCETNLARRIRANEISGKLARMVRSGELTRVKNSDGQYEYTSP